MKPFYIVIIDIVNTRNGKARQYQESIPACNEKQAIHLVKNSISFSNSERVVEESAYRF